MKHQRQGSKANARRVEQCLARGKWIKAADFRLPIPTLLFFTYTSSLVAVRNSDIPHGQLQTAVVPWLEPTRSLVPAGKITFAGVQSRAAAAGRPAAGKSSMSMTASNLGSRVRVSLRPVQVSRAYRALISSVSLPTRLQRLLQLGPPSL